MKKLNKIIVAWMGITLVSSLLPAQSSSTPGESTEVLAFRRLVEAALVANKSSDAKRVGIRIAREIVKIGGCFGFFMLEKQASKYGTNININDSLNQFDEKILNAIKSRNFKMENTYYLTLKKHFCVSILPLVIHLFLSAIFMNTCNFLIYDKDDELLMSLIKLMKFVKSLNTEQRLKINSLAKTYCLQLRKKIEREKDSISMNILTNFPSPVMTIQQLLPILDFLIKKKFNGGLIKQSLANANFSRTGMCINANQSENISIPVIATILFVISAAEFIFEVAKILKMIKSHNFSKSDEDRLKLKILKNIERRFAE